MSLLFLSSTSRKLYCKNSLINILFKRNILSSNYQCNEQWNKRLELDDTLNKISTERYFFELNQKYQQKQPVSALDIDIFINSLYKPESQQELEHILRQFRQTPKTVNTLESTHHAVCRFYLSNDKRTELIQILNQRIEYGIFPDQYCYNLILDQCIKEKEWEQAFQVTKLMMLQEDGGNNVSKTLALLALNQLLIDGNVGPKAQQQESKEPEESQEQNSVDEDEIEYIRVPYLTNPYFDDHFDLVNRDHIFGKTLYFFSRELEKVSQQQQQINDQILSHTGMIIGLIFYQKWDRLEKILERLSSTSSKITTDVGQILDKHIESLKSLQQDDKKILTELIKLKTNIEKSFETEKTTMSTLIEKRIEKMLPQWEQEDIKEQINLFEKFNENRKQVLNEQMDRLIKEKEEMELKENKQKMEQQKRLYYFFENFPKHEIDFMEAEKRIKDLQSKTIVEEYYVPPEKY